MKKKILTILAGLCFVMTITSFAVADDVQLAEKVHAILGDGPANDNYHVSANDVYMWTKMKKTDFMVLDVRIGENALEAYKTAHIPGAVYIPYNELFKPANLKKLPKDKKIILVCHMGAAEALPVIPLRMLGYNAYGMVLGMAGWQRGYPSAEYVRGLIDLPKTKDFPLERTK